MMNHTSQIGHLCQEECHVRDVGLQLGGHHLYPLLPLHRLPLLFAHLPQHHPVFPIRPLSLKCQLIPTTHKAILTNTVNLDKNFTKNLVFKFIIHHSLVLWLFTENYCYVQWLKPICNFGLFFLGLKLFTHPQARIIELATCKNNYNSRRFSHSQRICERPCNLSKHSSFISVWMVTLPRLSMQVLRSCRIFCPLSMMSSVS